MKNRYKVDERVGCAAIVDTFYPNDDQCLDSDNPGVIRYENLPRIDDNPQLRQVKLNILTDECKRLNDQNTVTREECEKVFTKFVKASAELLKMFPKAFQIQIR